MPVATDDEIELSTDLPPLDELRPIAEFFDLLHATKATVTRWIRFGAKKAGGVRLAAWDVNGWMTTEECVRAFIRRKTDGAMRNATRPGPESSPAMRKRVKAAQKALAAKGMKPRRTKTTK